MRTAIITISESGQRVASRLLTALEAESVGRGDVAACWRQFDAFVFVGAMGICVRTIAPLLHDKHSDPAVVCVDSMGLHAVSVVSGHVGGANDLTRQVARLLGAQPVITTQSDNAGLWPLDTLCQRFGWVLRAPASAAAPLSATPVAGGFRRGKPADTDSHGPSWLNEAIFRFVAKQPTALLLAVRDEGTAYLERTLPSHVTLVDSPDEVTASRYSLFIVVSPYMVDAPAGVPMLHYVPCVLTAGVGLAHQASPAETIAEAIGGDCQRAGLLVEAIRSFCTIDVKADEPFVGLLRQRGFPVRLFTAEELAKVDVPTPSAVVARHVGTPSVSEAAAILGSNHGELLLPKQKHGLFTLAVAMDRCHLRRGHVEIVGAGPGDPDLVSVRGRRLLEQADLILYAGSLVPRELTACHKPGAEVRSSADMALEEQCALMKRHYDEGHLIVRLHTGDPSLFGAIEEQMAFFDAQGMDYHITPGISSFLAAAAELRSQFTIPGGTQTVILTRGEGRTPVPPLERLRLLARSQSTMCIFLSASIVDQVQQELLCEYPGDTPVAVCYHLTWPDQRIYRGELSGLAALVKENGLTLTTMIVVGKAIGNRQGASELYNKHFTHLYRVGDSPGTVEQIEAESIYDTRQ